MDAEDQARAVEEQLESIRSWRREHPFGEQDEYGIDVGHLRANLRLTPSQRFEKHQRALALMLEARRAGRAARLSTNSRRS
jgi:hypothetical protein